MKRFLVILLFLTFAAGPAFAQYRPGTIDIYADADALTTVVYDSTPGIVEMYVFHRYGSGAASSQWKLEVPPCNGMTYLGDTNQFPTFIGSTVSGISIVYGACLNSPILLVIASWFGDGTTESCCRFQIVPDPMAPSGEIEVVDCTLNRMFAVGEYIYVNPTSECLYPPVEATTWGRVKALYR